MSGAIERRHGENMAVSGLKKWFESDESRPSGVKRKYGDNAIGHYSARGASRH